MMGFKFVLGHFVMDYFENIEWFFDIESIGVDKYCFFLSTNLFGYFFNT